MHCLDKKFQSEHFEDVPVGTTVHGNGYTATCLSDETKMIPSSIVRDGTDGGIGFCDCDYTASRTWSVQTDSGDTFTALQTLMLWRQSQTLYGDMIDDDDQWGVVSSSLVVDGVVVEERGHDDEDGPMTILTKSLEKHIALSSAPAP